jgi:hypothetical protein
MRGNLNLNAGHYSNKTETITTDDGDDDGVRAVLRFDIS